MCLLGKTWPLTVIFQSGRPLGDMELEAEAPIVVVNPRHWSERAQQLAMLLQSGARGPIGGPVAGPLSDFASLSDPDYWSRNVAELADALSDIESAEAHAPALTVSAITQGSSERLTMTVEEVARALGISRAFAYEAVRRGDIPHIKIGRRTLIPRAALARVLEVELPESE
jgi:excisionase family DNA binding protein